MTRCSHPRLAAVYDAFDGRRDDLDSYSALAGELSADIVLDVGCGTGSLAVLLAAGGRTVVAVDPAEASLEIAKAKDGAAKARWIHGDATVLPPLSADLAVITGDPLRLYCDSACLPLSIFRERGSGRLFLNKWRGAEYWRLLAANVHLLSLIAEPPAAIIFSLTTKNSRSDRADGTALG